jgi:hypothetical protein
MFCILIGGYVYIVYFIYLQAFDEMNIKQMKPIQQNSFLYLMKHYNTAMIGFSKGKSVSYLASIYSSIMRNSEDKVVCYKMYN